MHLYSGHDFQVDIRAYMMARKLRVSDALSPKHNMPPEEILVTVLRELGPDSIGGYRVEIGERLFQILRPLLMSTDETTRMGALDQLILYVAVQASSRDHETISSARQTFVEALNALSSRVSLKIAS